MRSRKISLNSNTWHFQFSIWLKCSFGEVHFAENSTWIGPVVPKLWAIAGFSKQWNTTKINSFFWLYLTIILPTSDWIHKTTTHILQYMQPANSSPNQCSRSTNSRNFSDTLCRFLWGLNWRALSWLSHDYHVFYKYLPRFTRCLRKKLITDILRMVTNSNVIFSDVLCLVVCEVSTQYIKHNYTILPHKVKTQYLHFRSHAEYFLLFCNIPEVMSRQSILFHN